MTVENAKIYNEGVEIDRDGEEKIRQIVTVIQMLSPRSDISLRLLKCDRSFEGLLWGKANNQPIGVYRRGASLSHVLDTLLVNVKRQCMKSRKVHAQTVMALTA